MRKVKNIKKIHAANSFILVELLTAQETMNTCLKLSDKTKPEAPQAYVLSIGSGLKDSNIKVGDRVLFSGGFVPTPSYDSERQQGIIDIYSIRAIIEEDNSTIKLS